MEEKKNKENILEQKAQNILRYLKSDVRYDNKFLPRPFFLEFTGSPSAGKTTTITELDKFLRRYGFRVLRPQEGAEVIRHIQRTTPLYNIRTGLYALNQLIDLSASHLYDVVIFDRCVFDAYCWMTHWREKEKLSFLEQKEIQSFFLSRFWTNMIDVVYFFVCEPEMAMKRELKISFSKRLGETTNPKTIKILKERYESAYKNLLPKYPQLRLIDTTSIKEKEMVEKISYEVVNALENKVKNGI